MRKQLAWLLLGLLFYVGGGVVFLVAVFSIWGPEGVSEEGFTTVALSLLVLSVLLFVTGGYFMRRGGSSGVLNAYGAMYQFGGTGGQRDEQSWSERQRAQYGAFDRSAIEDDREPEAVGGEQNDDAGVSCPHCGAHNESGFRFCGNCSKKLSG